METRSHEETGKPNYGEAPGEIAGADWTPAFSKSKFVAGRTK